MGEGMKASVLEMTKRWMCGARLWWEESPELMGG